MKVFIAAAFSTKVNYDTGDVFPEYKEWIELMIDQVEAAGHEVYCALKEDQFKINDADPVGAYNMDMSHIDSSDVLLALVDETASTGVQMEVGYAIAKGKRVYLAHDPEVKLAWFNDTMVKAGAVTELTYPLDISLIA